jgi:hypothetical protein
MRNGVSEDELIAVANAERVTLADVEAAIAGEYYFCPGHAVKDRDWSHSSLTLMTCCVLVLWNGYTLLGKSACASPANFDDEIGRRLARQDAVNQIWPLMGYDLKSRIARDKAMVEAAVVSNRSPLDGFYSYIGTKVVNATPMTLGQYKVLRGWTLSADDNGEDEGYLVEYTDRVHSPPLVPGFDGYVSWSPKDVFERAYRKVGG